MAVVRDIYDGGQLPAAARAAAAAVASIRTGGKLMFFGNGGSAADSMHLAAEFLGRFQRERRALPAIALADNHSAITAIGNDYAYRDVFSRQVSGLGVAGDVALGLSTSGQSENVAEALLIAGDLGLVTVAMTGQDPGRVGAAAEIVIAVPSSATARIQEAHMLLGHLICELVEDEIAAE